MKYINSYLLLRHQLNRLKHFKDRTDHFAENYHPAAAEDDGKIRMDENRIYIGLNDAEIKKAKVRHGKIPGAAEASLFFLPCPVFHSDR